MVTLVTLATIALLAKMLHKVMQKEKVGGRAAKRPITDNDIGWAVVGESYLNPDGTSRQRELARCRTGEPIELREERTNPHDPNAVAVISVRGVQIGYLSRDDAVHVVDGRQNGIRFDASISCILGGTPEKPYYGAWLDVDESEDEDE